MHPTTSPRTGLPSTRRPGSYGWLLALCCSAAVAQQGDGTDTSVTGHIFKPALKEASAERIAALKLPTGFSIAPFATGLKNARILAVSDTGDVYVARRDQGDVLLLKDADNDGKADGKPITVAHRPGAHGLAINDGVLYLATVNEIFRADIQPDGRLAPLTLFVKDLPDGGQHPNRTLAFGPDGMLYVSIGSTCNACNETNPESATLLQVQPDGKSRSIFASGLRNTIGFDWHPQTGQLWGMDHGIDFLGNDVQKEELNLIEKGKRYGWPHVYAEGGIDAQSTPPGNISKQQWKQLSTPMTLGYTAHAAPMQMVFYRGGAFPAEYQGDAFVAMRGSWNRKPASGYEIVRIRFANGKPQRIEPFATGFLSDGGTTHIARPVGLAVAKDGALLMSDDANGVIYRIDHDGPEKSQAMTPQTSNQPRKNDQTQTDRGPLAAARPETHVRGGQAKTDLSVSSAAWKSGQAIPAQYSEYADGVSPPIRWNAVQGAAAYALIVEDPDAKQIKPFTHWLAWNIPASTTELPEGLQEQLRLTEPEGVLQGANDRGSPGYFGPRPPEGDPPHHYHFQVFALDRPLDLPPGADRNQLLSAMQGHVLAKGELVGTYQQPAAGK